MEPHEKHDFPGDDRRKHDERGGQKMRGPDPQPRQDRRRNDHEDRDRNTGEEHLGGDERERPTPQEMGHDGVHLPGAVPDEVEREHGVDQAEGEDPERPGREPGIVAVEQGEAPAVLFAPQRPPSAALEPAEEGRPPAPPAIPAGAPLAAVLAAAPPLRGGRTRIGGRGNGVRVQQMPAAALWGGDPSFVFEPLRGRFRVDKASGFG